MKKNILLLLLINSLILNAESIKLWHGWMTQDKIALKTIVQRYESVSGNKIEMLTVPFDALQNKFSMMSPQGQGPDVLIGPADWIGVLTEQKLIDSIDSMITDKERKAFIPMAIKGSSYKGHLYGLPESIHIVTMFYNKDLVPNPPKTTKEMIKLGLDLTNEKANKYGLVYDKGNYYFHACWVGGFEGELISDDDTPTFDTKGQIEAAKFAKSLSEKPTKIMPDECDYNTTALLFGNGSAGMMLDGNWAIGTLTKSGKINFGIIPIPTVSQTGKNPLPIMGPEVAMISSRAKNKALAYDFIKFLTSLDSQEEFSKIGHIPTRNAVFDLPSVKSSNQYEYLMAFKKQIDDATPMPTCPEMNKGIWGEGNTLLSKVLTTNEPIESIAKEAQAKAMASISEYRKSRK